MNPTTNTAADLVPWEPARPLTAHAFARIEAERPSPTAEDDERAYKEWAALDATRFGPVNNGFRGSGNSGHEIPG